jgi:hypothetical protein
MYNRSAQAAAVSRPPTDATHAPRRTRTAHAPGTDKRRIPSGAAVFSKETKFAKKRK